MSFLFLVGRHRKLDISLDVDYCAWSLCS